MKFLDSVAVTEAPQLLSDLVAAKGYKGDTNFRNVCFSAADDGVIFVKKKLTASEAAPTNDGTVGVPVSALGTTVYTTLQTTNIWVFTKAGSGTKPLYISENDGF